MGKSIFKRAITWVLALSIIVSSIPAYNVKAANNTIEYTYNGEKRIFEYTSNYNNSCYYNVNTGEAVVINNTEMDKCTDIGIANTVIIADEYVTNTGLTVLYKKTMAECRSQLYNLYITDGITELGSSVCASLHFLKTVELGNAVTKIGNGAFSECRQLGTINIPDTVTTIGDKAFYKTTKLKNINIPSSLTYIGAKAFEYSSVRGLDFSKATGLSSIGDYAFHSSQVDCEIIPENFPALTHIGEKAFTSSRIVSVTITPNMKSIGVSAFEHCKSLENVLIYNGYNDVTTVGSYGEPDWFGGYNGIIQKLVISKQFGETWDAKLQVFYDMVFPGILKTTVPDTEAVFTPGTPTTVSVSTSEVTDSYYVDGYTKSYQWYKCDTKPTGTISSTSGTPIAGATSETLEFDSAGTYYVFCKVTTSQDNFDDYENFSNVATVTIDKGQQDVSVTAPDKKFDGTAYDESTITVTSTTGNTPTVTWYDSNKTALTEAPSALGDYFIKVSVPGSESYHDYESDFVAAHIVKGDITATVKAKDADYTGTLYDADANVTVSDVTELYTGSMDLVYFESEDNSQSTIPCPSQPGTYYVAPHFSGDDNFNETTLTPVKFVINKDKPVFAIEDVTKVYDGEALEITAEVSKSKFDGAPEPTGTLSYKYYTKENGEYKLMDSAPINAGVYYAEAIYSGDSHYGECSSNKVKLTIEKAETKIVAKEVLNAEYDGKVKEVPYEVSGGMSETDKPTGEVTFRYYTDEDCKSVATNPENAGTYYVKAVLAADTNYKSSTSEPVKLVIKRASITGTFTINGKTYDGKPLSGSDVTFMFNVPTDVAQVPTFDMVEFTNTKTVDGSPVTADGLPTEAGTYEIKAVLVESTNYNKLVLAPVNVTIDKETVTIDTTDIETYRIGKPVEVTVPVTGDNSTEDYSDVVELTFYTDENRTVKTGTADGALTSGGAPENKGTYYVTAKVAEGVNNLEATANLIVNVVPPRYQITFEDDLANERTGEPIEIEPAIIKAYDGTDLTTSPKVTYTYFTDEACTVKTDATYGAVKAGGAPAALGTYYVVVDIDTDNLHEAGSDVATFEIVKAFFKIESEDMTVKYDGSEKNFDYKAYSTIKDAEEPTSTVVYYTDDKLTAMTTSEDGAAANGGAPINAGTYYVEITCDETADNSETVNTEFTLTIEQVELTKFELSEVKFVYNNELGADPVVTIEGIKDGSTPDASKVVIKYYEDEACTKAVDKPVNAGTYYVTGTCDSERNYVATTSKPVTYTIEKKPYDADLAKDELANVKGGVSVIEGVTDKMEYKRHSDEEWTAVPADATKVTKLPGSKYEVRMKGDDNTAPSESVTVIVTKQNTPNIGNNTGVISGLDPEDEILIDGIWVPVKDLTTPYKYDPATKTVSGLPLGDYEVKFQEGDIRVIPAVPATTVGTLKGIKPGTEIWIDGVWYPVEELQPPMWYDKATETIYGIDTSKEIKLRGPYPTYTKPSEGGQISPIKPGTEIFIDGEWVPVEDLEEPYSYDPSTGTISGLPEGDYDFREPDTVITIPSTGGNLGPVVPGSEIFIGGEWVPVEDLKDPYSYDPSTGMVNGLPDGDYHVKVPDDVEKMTATGGVLHPVEPGSQIFIDGKWVPVEDLKDPYAYIPGDKTITGLPDGDYYIKKPEGGSGVAVKPSISTGSISPIYPNDKILIDGVWVPVTEVKLPMWYDEENLTLHGVPTPNAQIQRGDGTIETLPVKPDSDAEVVKPSSVITGITPDMEILIDGVWYPVTNLPAPAYFDPATGTIHKLPPGKYEIRIAGTDDKQPSSSVTVEVVKPTAPEIDNDGKTYITGITPDMEVRVLPDGEWTKVTEVKPPLAYNAETHTLTGLKKGSYAFRYAENDKDYASDEIIITVGISDAPVGFSVENNWIIGTTSEMEYAAYKGDLTIDEQYMGDDPSLLWSTCYDGKTATGDGVFVIRYKETSQQGLSYTKLVKVGIHVEQLPDYTYTGSKITPKPVVYDGDDLLVAGVHYTLSYKNNKNAYTYTQGDAKFNAKKAPTIIIKGKGNYTKSTTVTFKIQPKNLADSDVVVTDVSIPVNNKVQRKAPTIKYGKLTLKNNKDFTCAYPDTVANAYLGTGRYSVVVTGKGNFIGTVTAYQNMADKDHLIAKAKIAKIPAKQYVAGKPVELNDNELVVTLAGLTLVKDRDYVVSYANNNTSGTATVTITGIGSYVGTKSANFKIIGTPISKVQVTGIEAKTYTGKGVVQDKLVLTYNGTTLKPGTDYIVVYTNNIKKGTAKMAICGIGAYTGQVKKSFKISPYDIAKDIDANKVAQLKHVAKFQKGGAKLNLVINALGNTLVEGTDYTVTYKNNKKVATTGTSKSPVAIVTGRGNFTGTIKIPFAIVARDLNDVDFPVTMTVANVAKNSAKGKFISKPVVKDADGVLLKLNKDYTTKYYKVETNGAYTELTDKSSVNGAATIKVDVTGRGAYTGTISGFYEVRGADFTKVKVSIRKQQYTGSCIYLDANNIQVTHGSGRDKLVLKAGKDYEIVPGSYVNNIKAGTAKVTLRGIGDYSGEKTVKFKIYKRVIKIGFITIRI